MRIMNVAIVLAIVFATANAAPYSKFGRSCQDIGCRSDERCIMAEEPCSYGHQREQCGRYPTCQRINSGGESCTTKICPSGQYCRTENGRPTCVNTNAGLDPASRRQPGYRLPTTRTTTRRPIPTPPPRSSSFDHRFGGNGIGGGASSTWDRNFGGGSRGGSSSNGGAGSTWDRNFGGGSRGGSSYTTKRPSYYPGGKDHYNTHTSTEDVNKRQEETQQSSDPKPSAPLPDNMGYPADTRSTPRPAAAYPNYPSPSNSGYPSYPNSQKPSSPNHDRFGYPMQSQTVGSYPGYPSSGSSAYPSSNNNHGYPSYPSQDSSRRTSATTNNAGYPSYPNQAAGGYPGQAGYPPQNPYNNNPYGAYRPQQQQPGPYQGGYYPQQQNNGYYDPYGPATTKKPSFTDKIANYAKNVAKQVLTQAIIDKVSGRS